MIFQNAQSGRKKPSEEAEFVRLRGAGDDGSSAVGVARGVVGTEGLCAMVLVDLTLVWEARPRERKVGLSIVNCGDCLFDLCLSLLMLLGR